jgi:hypothetical protein
LVDASQWQVVVDRAALGSTTSHQVHPLLRLYGHAHAVRWWKSGEVQGETFEVGKRAVLESPFVSSPQDHAGRAARLQCFAPAGCTQAPAVAGPQAGKAELGHRRRKIITARFGELEKLLGHDDADRVAADVLSTGVAATVTKEPRLGVHRAIIEPAAENIPRRTRATSTVPAVVPQHCRLLDRPLRLAQSS